MRPALRAHRCVVLLATVCVSGLADAEEASVTEPPASRNVDRGEARWSHTPRLLIDRVAGQLRPSALEGFAGPLSASISDSAGFKQNKLAIALDADVRVWKGLTLGGSATFGLQNWLMSTGGPEREELDLFVLALGARVGVLVPLAKDLYLWPRVGVGLDLVGQGARNVPDPSNVSIVAMADLSLVVPLHRYLFVALGPRVDLTHRTLGPFDENDNEQLKVSFTSRLGLSF